eukprot:6177943-Pleurochrysis_carterae.AAC.1
MNKPLAGKCWADNLNVKKYLTTVLRGRRETAKRRVISPRPFIPPPERKATSSVYARPRSSLPLTRRF